MSAKGSGAKARFAAIFASREETDPLTFRSQGPVTIAAIDKVMQDCMQTQNLRGLALAIARGTQLVYAKGYTYADPGYPDITPQTLFRQASVSKTFTGIAMMRLLRLKPNIMLTTPVQSIMNLKQPNGSAPADPRWKDITIQHLIESDSGIPQSLIYSSAAAAKAFGTPLPATPAQLVSYATTLMLTGKPGDKNNAVYGNFDYILLGQIIAKLQGAATYEQALTQLVLQPLHQTHTRGSRSLIADQLPGEARHHMIVYAADSGWRLYPFEVLPSVRAPGGKLEPTHYGALDFEIFSSAGGLSSSMVDVARLGAMFSDRLANPVLGADNIDKMLSACAAAYKTLRGPDGKPLRPRLLRPGLGRRRRCGKPHIHRLERRLAARFGQRFAFHYRRVYLRDRRQLQCQRQLRLADAAGQDRPILQLGQSGPFRHHLWHAVIGPSDAYGPGDSDQRTIDCRYPGPGQSVDVSRLG